MNYERLLNVAKALRESREPEMFGMDAVLNECGSPQCAFGHYAARTDLQDVWEIGPSLDGDGDVEVVFVSSLRRAKYSGDEVMEHFGITPVEHSDLFDPGGCGGAQTAIEAAEYIENFVLDRRHLPPKSP